MIDETIISKQRQSCQFQNLVCLFSIIQDIVQVLYFDPQHQIYKYLNILHRFFNNFNDLFLHNFLMCKEQKLIYSFLNSLKRRRHSRRNIVYQIFSSIATLKTNSTMCLSSADVYQCIHNLILWGKSPNHHEVPNSTRTFFF